ncbi:alpha/beta fold hydrolase [Saccharopolyspora dendranthemae]|uniref:Pimeloyl-ACP methyl ester carboxylesterase n=1 Tax=Saccharopolyspora dendranthemae TaxID=1181886 RepID=A0A561U1Q1_9PSEU|nr:alpha/beta hydrolase [Saccharopolyspora dendranthemae]TWF93276.1 pimeloyl-ACP methyl ester carboxylesterase [Saccharopolyspora dendranthemae]
MQTITRPEFITSDGAQLRLIDEGPADAPVTVLFVHGWTLSKHSWDRIAAGLPAAAGRNVRTLRFDLRGHGASRPAEPGEATIARCAEDLAEIIADRVPAGPIVLAGHSMGGMAIMALAEQHPQVFDRVRGVALVATSSGDLAAPSFGLPQRGSDVFNAGERALRRYLASSGAKRVSGASAWLRPGVRWLLFGKQAAREDVAATASWLATCHPKNMAAYRESLAVHERAEALARLNEVPTLVLAGLSDRLTPKDHADKIARALPNARFYLYPGAGHMLPLERTAEITTRIATLL